MKDVRTASHLYLLIRLRPLSLSLSLSPHSQRFFLLIYTLTYYRSSIGLGGATRMAAYLRLASTSPEATRTTSAGGATDATSQKPKPRPIARGAAWPPLATKNDKPKFESIYSSWSLLITELTGLYARATGTSIMRRSARVPVRNGTNCTRKCRQPRAK